MILDLPFDHLLLGAAKIIAIFVEVRFCGGHVMRPVLAVEVLDGLGAKERFFAGGTEGFYFGGDGSLVGGRVPGDFRFDLAFVDHIHDGYGAGPEAQDLPARRSRRSAG
jgi:hypothetical protein